MGRLASDVSLQILGAVVDLLEQVQSAQENDPNVTAADVKHFISSRLTVDGQRLLAGLEEFYELSFIIDSILQPMFDERLPLVRRMMAEIHDTLHSIPVPAKSNKPLTEPEPFLLTKIEPRKILVPQPIPSVIKAHPVPVSHYTKLPKAEMAIERSRHKHRIEQRDRLLQSDLKQFEVVKKTEEMIRQKREEAERAKLNSKPATNVPVIKRNGTASWTEALKSGKAVEVKKTNAEILRQEAYVRKRREDERRKFETELSQGVAGTMTDKEFELFEQQVRIQGIL
jgi:hypothetical protein